jgi:apolipoprotein N-acyltransferase
MFVFNAVTLYWVGGFTHGRDPWLMMSGGALLLFHPILSSIPIMTFGLVRPWLNRWLGLLAFVFFWVSWEYIHALGEVSFPWITLGNSQAYDLARSQIVEYTSVYGISFLLLGFNLVGYYLLVQRSLQDWKLWSPRPLALILILLLLYLLPWWYGMKAMERIDDGGGVLLNVGVIQPNVDPWEKWGDGASSRQEAYQRQLEILFESTSAFAKDSLDLMIWPETAIPFWALLPQYERYRNQIQRFVDSLNTPLFTGLPHAEYFDERSAPVTAQPVGSTSLYVDSYNSAVLFSPGKPVSEVYRKVVLVPFAERVPYAESVPFLVEPLKWGVGISGWGKGADTLVYEFRTRSGEAVTFGGMICYESIFPQFVRTFVQRGADVLVVITNDSWWGNTSGAYQHIAIASLRAIETRRWVIQSANGGISAFVDPAGRIHQATAMYAADARCSAVQSRSGETFYTRHGDIAARLGLYCSLVFVILAFVNRFRRKEWP